MKQRAGWYVAHLTANYPYRTVGQSTRMPEWKKFRFHAAGLAVGGVVHFGQRHYQESALGSGIQSAGRLGLK